MGLFGGKGKGEEKGQMQMQMQAQTQEQEQEQVQTQAKAHAHAHTPQQRYAYEIFPVNFIMLPEQRQDELTSRFHLFLNSIPSTIRVAMVRGKRGVELGPDRTAVVEYPTFFIECGEPLDDILEATRFIFQRVDAVPVLRIRGERWSHLVLEDGRLAQCLTVYALPAELPIGFLSELYGTAEIVQFTAVPVSPEEASDRLENYKRALRALVSAGSRKGRSPSQDLMNRLEMAERALAAVSLGSSRLFRTSTTFVVTGSSLNELREKVRQLRNRLNSRRIRVDLPKLVQGRLYEGKGKVLYVDTGTLGAFYPFVAGEVLESGGIFLGINALSGAPVVYNPLVRPNVNISIIGTSGAGKSFTSKIFLNRLIARDPEIPFYVIDPEGEYTPLVEWLGGQVIHVKNFEGTGLGLDPLLLFEKGEAADAVCNIAGLTERKDISRVRDLVMSSRSLEELYQKLPQDLAEKFSSMRGGPESFIFQGEPLSFTPRMSFDMRGDRVQAGEAAGLPAHLRQDMADSLQARRLRHNEGDAEVGAGGRGVALHGDNVGCHVPGEGRQDREEEELHPDHKHPEACGHDRRSEGWRAERDDNGGSRKDHSGEFSDEDPDEAGRGEQEDSRRGLRPQRAGDGRRC
jgi:hypothetical protein